MIHSPMETIQELINKEQWVEAFPIMKQLRTDLTQENEIRPMKGLL
ncbi:hypothetical protein ACEWK1_02385 [Metabacillus sp. YM-086]